MAVIPIDDLRLLEELENERDLAVAREGIAEAERQGTIGWEEAKSERRANSRS